MRCAYQQLPLDSGDIDLFGLEWKEKYFIDISAPFGLKSSALMCQRVTNAISYIMACNGYHLIKYLDDLASARKPDSCWCSFNFLECLLHDLRVTEAPAKACAPTTCMVFLGVEIDTAKRTISIPQDKYMSLQQLLTTWLNKTRANLCEVQSIIVELQAVTNCVRFRRVFLARILRFLRQISQSKPFTQYFLTEEFKKDISCWLL